VLARPPHEVLPQLQFCRANTVLQWLVEAAEQLHAFSRYFLCDVHVKQWQLDELYAILRERVVYLQRTDNSSAPKNR
jgi:hypothetical protein